jgi:hypothetical protein
MASKLYTQHSNTHKTNDCLPKVAFKTIETTDSDNTPIHFVQNHLNSIEVPNHNK